ncbi:hypothetical protein [Acuticoccus kandeliae]|uniref:hypothetical protein n=1 Tax=Acuticoccus kandeliae TaxID=2073160 RepID=UPI000D3ECF99|nr:hypothetical protein [Acuticoccus kandeliae]
MKLSTSLRLSAIAIGLAPTTPALATSYSCWIETSLYCYGPPISGCRRVSLLKLIRIDTQSMSVRLCVDSGCDHHRLLHVEKLATGDLRFLYDDWTVATLDPNEGTYVHSQTLAPMVDAVFGRCHED